MSPRSSEIGEQTTADVAGKKPARQTDEMCVAVVSWPSKMTPSSFARLLNANGFEVIECRTRIRYVKISLNQRNVSLEQTLSHQFNSLSLVASRSTLRFPQVFSGMSAPHSAHMLCCSIKAGPSICLKYSCNSVGL